MKYSNQKIILENFHIKNLVYNETLINTSEIVPILLFVDSPNSVVIMNNISISDIYVVDDNPD